MKKSSSQEGKKLTRAEEEIMQIIWELGRCTVSNIRDYMEQKMNVEKPPHSTVSTIVRILQDKKGFLDFKAYGRTYEYFPIISKKEYTKNSLTKLVNDYFGGSMNSLVSFMVEEKDLKASELGELLNDLEEADD